ncbi:hypothetical protein PAMP_018518 [Pampus punctatissimus]
MVRQPRNVTVAAILDRAEDPNHISVNYLSQPVAKQTSWKAEDSLSVDCSLHFQVTEPLPNAVRLSEALARVESLKREMRNAKDREQRAVHDLLEDLREKNLVNQELKERLNFYSDFEKAVLRCVLYQHHLIGVTSCLP